MKEKTQGCCFLLGGKADFRASKEALEGGDKKATITVKMGKEDTREDETASRMQYKNVWGRDGGEGLVRMEKQAQISVAFGFGVGARRTNKKKSGEQREELSRLQCLETA